MSETRFFLFLQGPHGPFFSVLGHRLWASGHGVLKVGFNAADEACSRDASRYHAFKDEPENWPETFAHLVDKHGVTDLVLYGDTRPIHATSIEHAKKVGLRVHIFEEGYMRPYWVTYERDGSNGNSRLMHTSLEDIQKVMGPSSKDLSPPPDFWGEMTHHAYYGTLYHTALLLRRKAYPAYRSHRALPLEQEFRDSLRTFLSMPIQKARRRRKTRALKRSGLPYHLVLMQLAHDANFINHSPFSSVREFCEEVIAGFATGAPTHHVLVFKAHPMESAHSENMQTIMRVAQGHGVRDRVKYIPGGKLAQILEFARTAITVNSTAAQQALWRGIPLKIFGDAVYAKPELVSEQPIAEFFQDPTRPDREAYLVYRRYLLETSQVVGGYYSKAGRYQIMRQIVDMMLSEGDPYEARAQSSGEAEPQLNLIASNQ